jgi:tetratricopeptide (TPR) repeat protein
MKKIFLLIAAVSISLGILAQKGKVTTAQSYIDQGALDKAKEALDQAFTDEKSKDWFNTYFVKGKLCVAIYEADNPKFNSYFEDPLAEAYTAYEKSMELDPKGGTKKKIITQLVYNSLAINLYKQGSTKFDAKDYAGAFKSFDTQIKITESDKFAGGIDTGMYYNAGLAAVNSGKYKEGIKYFEKCVEFKYLGITPYLQISECYIGLGDSIKAETFLLDLPNKFPGDKTVYIKLADFYLKANKPNDAIKYIEISKEKDPTNYSLYFAEGITYLNQNKYDEAIRELSKSIELKADLFESQYGIGAAYINKAAEMFIKANDIMDVNKYEVAIKEANSVYEKALPYIQKAHGLNPNDLYAMRSLKELYYRLKMTSEYNDIKAKLDALEQK